MLEDSFNYRFIMRISSHIGFLFLFMFLVFVSAGHSVFAQSNDSGHIKITADRPAIIPLNDDATSVIVGNPAHATASLDNANTLIVNPLRPGATSLIVLDERGTAIFETQLLINPPKSNYVRINRVCSASTRETCRETSVFYCVEGCHEMVIPGQDVEGGMAQSDGDSVEAAEPEAEGEIPPAPPTPAEFEE